MSTDSLLGERLKQQLTTGDQLPQPRVSPGLAYGRHRGPTPNMSRIAAVLVALYLDANGNWTIPLTLRPRSLQHHGGQVCLPGGQVEADEDVYTASLREFEEELGICPDVRHDCGELSSLYVYSSDNLVYPVVAVIEKPTQPWRPDPIEVEEVIEMPLGVLLDDSTRTELVKQRVVRNEGKEVGRLSFRATAFCHGDHLIWGATAMILDQLARILQQP